MYLRYVKNIRNSDTNSSIISQSNDDLKKIIDTPHAWHERKNTFNNCQNIVSNNQTLHQNLTDYLPGQPKYCFNYTTLPCSSL